MGFILYFVGIILILGGIICSFIILPLGLIVVGVGSLNLGLYKLINVIEMKK